MFTKILLNIFFLFLSSACLSSSAENKQTLLTNSREIESQTANINILEFPDDEEVNYSKIKRLKIDLNESSIYLLSDKENAEGYSIPPYTQAEVQNIFFFKSPKIGTFATVIPLEVAIEPITLKVLSKKKRTENSWWEVELEKIKKKEFLQISNVNKNRREQYPFDVCVIYPAIKNAKAIPRNDIEEKDLPSGVKKNSIYAAIDLNQDNQPDYIIVRYCKSGEDAIYDCEFDVSAIFVKNKKTWKVLRREGC